MPKRMFRFAAAALSLLAALAADLLTTRTSLAQRAADECVTRPGSTAPQGSHWYYRYDRANARQCWYLGPEGTKVVSAVMHRAPVSELRLPSPRPSFLADGGDAYASADPLATIAERSPGGGSGDTAASFAQRWPRSAVSPGAVGRVALASADATSANLTIAGGSREEPVVANGPDGLPLVWPVLTADERGAVRAPFESMTTLDRLLAVLAAVLSLVAIAGQVLVRQSGARPEPALAAPAAPSSAVGRRARGASAAEARQYVRNIPQAEMRVGAPVRRPMSRG